MESNALQTTSTLPQSSSGRPRNKSQDVLHKACDLCKRRKVRCSGTNPCQQCSRNKAVCSYSSTHGKLTALERRLRQSEIYTRNLEAAWESFLPDVDLSQAVEAVTTGNVPPTPSASSAPSLNASSSNLEDVSVSQASRPLYQEGYELRTPSPHDLEFDTIEALEWDETVEKNILTDGIGSLSLQTSASGYMGPQSGNALLRHLHSVVHFLSEGESDVDFSSFPAVRVTSSNTRDFLRSTAFRNQCVDWYFQHFHKAYPLLHEGLFRAQYMVHDLGAVPKPKDGSWPVLCNMVLAVGAFAGPESATRADIFFSGEAQSAVSFALLQRGSVHLVQAFLLLANYLQKRNKPNSGFTLLYDARIE